MTQVAAQERTRIHRGYLDAHFAQLLIRYHRDNIAVHVSERSLDSVPRKFARANLLTLDYQRAPGASDIAVSHGTRRVA